MTETEKRKLDDLDTAAEEAGGYVTNFADSGTHYNLREIIRYCKNKGIEPADLTLRELSLFVTV